MQKVNEDNFARKYPKVHFDTKIGDIENVLNVKMDFSHADIIVANPEFVLGVGQ